MDYVLSRSVWWRDFEIDRVVAATGKNLDVSLRTRRTEIGRGRRYLPQLETVVTIIFKDEGSKTRMLFRQSPFQSDVECDGHGMGWNSSLDRMDDYLVELNRSNA
jgi:uncharacterized protein YndB with AHSA1/START domain